MSKVCKKCGAILQGNKIIYDIDSSLDCKHKFEECPEPKLERGVKMIVFNDTENKEFNN